MMMQLSNIETPNSGAQILDVGRREQSRLDGDIGFTILVAIT